MTTSTVTPPKKPEGPMPKPQHPDYPASGETNWDYWFPAKEEETKENDDECTGEH